MKKITAIFAAIFSLLLVARAHADPAFPTTNMQDAWYASDLSLGANATWTGHNHSKVITLNSGVGVDDPRGKRWLRYKSGTLPVGTFPGTVTWDTRNCSFYVLQRLTGNGLMTFIPAGPSLYANAIVGPSNANAGAVYSAGANDSHQPIGHNKQLIGFRASASALKIAVGGIETSLTALSASTDTGGNLYYNNAPASTSSGSVGARSDIAYILCYSAPLSDADFAQLQTTAASLGFEAKANALHLTIDGDSRSSGYLLDTAGQGSDIWDDYWPEQFASLNAESPFYVDYAVAGQKLSQCVTNASSNIDPYVAKGTGFATNAVYIWADVNDVVVGGRNASQIWADYQTYAAARRAANPGVKIWGAISYTMNLSTAEQTEMTNLKNLILADTTGVFDKLFRFDQIPELNDGTFNTTYFQADGIHLKKAGQTLLAQAMYNALTPNPTPSPVITPTSPMTATSCVITINVSGGTPPYTYSTSQHSGPATTTITASTSSTPGITFPAAGNYGFDIIVTDSVSHIGHITNMPIEVDQATTSVRVAPGATTIKPSATKQFTATALDQFGTAMTSQPTFTFSNTGSGSVDSSGLYTAPAATGTDVVRATTGSLHGDGRVTISSATKVSGTHPWLDYLNIFK